MTIEQIMSMVKEPDAMTLADVVGMCEHFDGPNDRDMAQSIVRLAYEVGVMDGQKGKVPSDD